MNCQNCGYPLEEGVQFCRQCGAYVPAQHAQPSAPASAETTVLTPDQAPAYTQQPVAQAEQPQYAAPAAPAAPAASKIPSQYRPLSPWAYFGLQILYSIPLVGFIFLIIFSFKSDNLNRRNFTRSYWCALLIGVIIGVVAGVIMFILAAVLGAEMDIGSIANSMM